MYYDRSGRAVYEPVTDFWVATNRTSLLNYLTKQYPNDTDKFMGMKKNRLTAIYINTRKRRG
jgi:hypothetical protein